jgi:hypothetical protein
MIMQQAPLCIPFVEVPSRLNSKTEIKALTYKSTLQTLTLDLEGETRRRRNNRFSDKLLVFEGECISCDVIVL